jgi:DNA-binding NarL/FixJ family response regulator
MVKTSPKSKESKGAVGIVRVLLADDHELVRAGIRSLLEKMSNIEIVGEVGNGREAIRLVEMHEPDVVLTDIDMPGMNGLEVTRHLAKTFPAVRAVILSMYSDEEHVYLALRAGAAGYLPKAVARQELALAIRAVAQGDIYLSPSISKPIVMENCYRGNDSAPPLKGLSPRQTQVLQLIAKGKTTKQIALLLKISVKTVETHRLLLMDRLQIHDIPSLVRFAIKVGLIELED